MLSLSKITSYRSAHLKEVNMSYFHHMAYALGYSIATLGISAIFLIHAFIPDLLKSTGSDGIAALHTHFQLERNINTILNPNAKPKIEDNKVEDNKVEDDKAEDDKVEDDKAEDDKVEHVKSD